jgi:hypothetical protein
VKVLIDGVDMTLNFDVRPINSEEDVGDVVSAVSHTAVCTGIEGFEPDDIIYLPFAKKRGCRFFSDACPVVLVSPGESTACNPCTTLRNELIERKQQEEQHMARRRAK